MRDMNKAGAALLLLLRYEILERLSTAIVALPKLAASPIIAAITMTPKVCATAARLLHVLRARDFA